MRPARGPESGRRLELEEHLIPLIQNYLQTTHTLDPVTGCWIYRPVKGVNMPTSLAWGKWRPARHKLACAAFNGPVAEGQIVRHRCNNPPCFNPKHLLSGTQRESQEDKSIRGRARNGSPSLPGVRVYPPGKKAPVGLSLDEELAEWALNNAKPLGFKNRNVLIEELLRAFRAGTMPIRQPNAFPGESPDNPVLVSFLK